MEKFGQKSKKMNIAEEAAASLASGIGTNRHNSEEKGF